MTNPMSPVTEFDGSNAILKSNMLRLANRVLASNVILSGQQCGHLDGNYDRTALKAGGRTAAVFGVDLGYEDYSGDYSNMIADAAEHASQGGIVQLSFHPRNPSSGGYVDDRSPVDFGMLLTPGNRVYSNWRGNLQNIGNILQELKSRHVVVLWRPLHEANGDWFWWCGGPAGPSPAQYTSLWRDMFDYFTTVRKLDNLLWVYSPNYVFDPSKMKSVSYYYPGAAYVDFTGLDVYAEAFDTLDSFRSSYAELATLGKPMALTELGPPSAKATADWDLMAAAGIRETRNFWYVLAWSSWPGHPIAIRDNRKANEFMGHARVITLDEIGGL